MRVFIALIASSFAPSLFAACQQTAPPGSNLVQQLQAMYVATVMETSGLKVAQPGCTMVIQKDGVTANPFNSKVGSYYENTYEDGEVKGGAKSKLFGGASGIPGLKATNKPLAAMDKVYLLKMEVVDKGIAFYVQTCGTCDPSAADPAHKPFRAKITVSFLKGFMTATDLPHIKQAVSEILAFPDDAAAAGGQQVSQAGQAGAAPQAAAQAAPQAAPAPLPEIAPPPPPEDAPAPDPVTVGIGQTPDQVKAAFGEPTTKAKAGPKKEIWIYKNLKVTFIDGKVSDVQ